MNQEWIREFIAQHILRRMKSICWAWSVLWSMGYKNISVNKKANKCGYCGNCMSKKDMTSYEELIYEADRMHRLLRDK